VRLSDVLGCHVQDRDGRDLGRVSDIRVVQDGPIVDGVQAAFRAEALLVGHGGFAERLGYVRGHVRGPWLLKMLFTWLERHAVYIPVSDVATWNTDSQTIQLSTTDIHRRSR
jgi:hypothetical protein